jgi:hypothetical protein
MMSARRMCCDGPAGDIDSVADALPGHSVSSVEFLEAAADLCYEIDPCGRLSALLLDHRDCLRKLERERAK